jgi:cell shape-determining protein MreC
MAYIMQLKHLIESELIPDVEDHIDELFEGIASAKDATPEERSDLEELQALRDEYKELLKELQSGDIDEEEAEQLYTELTAMREGGDDEDDLDYDDDEDDEDEDDYDEFDIDKEDEQY